MELSYRQLEATLGAFVGVHPDKMGTFRSRVKQLQRMNFPLGVNIGRGSRMAYSALHLFQLAIAFELLGTGWPAKPAVEVTTEFWDRFETAIGAAFARTHLGNRGLVFAVVRSDALKDMGGAPGSGDQDKTVTIEDSDALSAILLEQASTARPTSFVVLKISRIYELVGWFVKEVGRDDNLDRSVEMRQWKGKFIKSVHPWNNVDDDRRVPF